MKTDRIYLFFPFKTDSLISRKTKKKGISLTYIFIDQSKLSSGTYNCLKRSNIHTLFDFLNHSQEDLMKMKYFRMEDVKHMLGTLQKHF
ncbi:DNA-directed RNA polymerase subunit alpha [Platanthera guangdongensis]|uniref:DNA-directed RNA polymerase subunit alpha n=1 Tax=Platanthera guangdongensis TaxID=2320717 RepID=A0ABR2MFT4_9ASPA